MSTTVRDNATLAFEPESFQHRWGLIVVHHPSAEVLGLRRVITPAAALELGRSCGAFGDGTFNDPCVSRSHARLELDSRGALTVSDLGSANGTWVDGARVAHAALRAGSLLRVGPVLLLSQFAPETYPLRRSERCPAVAWSTVDFSERLRRALAARHPLALRGVRPSAWRPLVGLSAEHLGLTLLDVAALAAPLRDRECGVVAVSALAAPERMVLPATVRDAAAVVLRAGSRIDDASEWVELSLPALHERLEDLPWLVRGALHGALGEVPEFDASFASRLLLAEWPEDVDGVHRWAASVARRFSHGERLVWSGEDLALAGGPRTRPGELGAPASTSPRASRAPVLKVSRDGAWFAAESEAPVDLRTRFALSRVLQALVGSHLESAEQTLSLDDLVAAGWPGERLLADSASNRAYVAIATLRKLGLRELIERREGGYRLAVNVATELVDAPPTRRHGGSA